MHDKDPHIDLARAVLTVTAARAAAELDHRMTVRRLAEAESRYHAFLDEMAEGVIVTDMDDVITFVNGRISALTGYSREEMLGKLASTLLVPEEGRRSLYARNDRRRQGQSEVYEVPLQKRDGERFPARVSASPHRDGRARLSARLPSFPSRRILRRGGGGFPGEEGLLEKAQDAVFVCDPDDTILFWNSSAADLYGWTADEARGRPRRSCSTRNRSTVPVERRTRRSSEGYWAGELRQKKKDGSTVLVDSRWTRHASGPARSPRSGPRARLG